MPRCRKQPPSPPRRGACADVAELAFAMPALGADMERGRVVRWRVKPGDTIGRGQVIVEVETDKGLIDVECFHDATVMALLVPEGVEVAVGAVIARLDVAGAAPTAEGPRAPPATEPARLPPTSAAPAMPPVATPLGARVIASPLARRRAAALGVDVATVAPGTSGRISAEDVERAAATSTRERDPKEAMRRAIAAAMAKSKREIPHYYLWQSVDVTDALAWLTAHNARRPVTERVLFGALVARAVARAAAAAPEMNGAYLEGAVRSSLEVHLGFATAQRGGGLVAPALLDAHTLDVDAMMSAIADVVARVKSGGLKSREMSAGTITLTALGELGVDGVLPVIQPPQLAIVGAGRVTERPWVVGGAVVVRSVLTLSLAADHRASDGHRGARFLQNIVKNLVPPEAP
ncbi:MAG: 2-oxo acid dehydrogenase subunit E2 [Deltaproteobacteria bacterium]|nr:2-oxo acid dehydrogenase subunit E2 [Deltaproteobacteria bacterium]